jgi:hypothetical protein
MHPTNKRICARGSEWLTPATPAPRRLKDDWFQASLGYTVRQRPNQLKIKKKIKSTTNDKADKGKKKKKGVASSLDGRLLGHSSDRRVGSLKLKTQGRKRNSTEALLGRSSLSLELFLPHLQPKSGLCEALYVYPVILGSSCPYFSCERGALGLPA